MTPVEARTILDRDKLEILEGYVTEDVYKKQFMNDVQYSQDWWEAERTDAQGNVRRVFFVKKNALNEVDMLFVRKLLQDNTVEVYQVLNINGQLRFMNLNSRNDYSLGELSNVLGLNRREYNPTPPDNIDHAHYEKCYDYMTENGILIECAEQRKLADDVISLYFNKMVNLDFIYADATDTQEGHLHVAEIKYKNTGCVDDMDNYRVPMNLTQAYLMDYLVEIHEINVDYYVLINRMQPRFNRGIRLNALNGIEYLRNTGGRYRDIIHWRRLGLEHDTIQEAINSEHETQDERTAVNGRYQVECVTYDYANFEFIQLASGIFSD